MKGSEFLRKVRKLGKANGINVSLVSQRGKGDHETLYYGDRYTVVPDKKKELKTGTLEAMLEQLGIRRQDL